MGLCVTKLTPKLGNLTLPPIQQLIQPGKLIINPINLVAQVYGLLLQVDIFFY